MECSGHHAKGPPLDCSEFPFTAVVALLTFQGPSDTSAPTVFGAIAKVAQMSGSAKSVDLCLAWKVSQRDLPACLLP